MGYWKKARDDFPAKFALNLAGGEFKNGKFFFSSVVRRDEYERILRRLEEEDGKVSATSHSRSKTTTVRDTRPVGGQRIYSNRGISYPRISG